MADYTGRDDTMNHDQIEERLIAERYLMGQLPPAEAAGFEDHYLGCAECVERLELLSRFENALRGVATEEVARAAATARLGVLAWLARLGRSRQISVLLGALVLLLLPSGFLSLRLARLGNELTDARIDLETARSGQAETGERVTRLEQDLASERRQADDRAAALEGRLAGALAARERLAEAVAEAERPRGNVPLLRLSPLRALPANDAPVHRLGLSAGTRLVVLVLEVDLQAASAYRATLSTKAGRALWTGRDLLPNAVGDLVLAVPGALLEPGDYQIQVEGRDSEGRRQLANGFSFRVTAAR